MKKELIEETNATLNSYLYFVFNVVCKYMIKKNQIEGINRLSLDMLVVISSFLPDIDKKNFSQCSKLIRSAVEEGIRRNIPKTIPEIEKKLSEKIATKLSIKDHHLIEEVNSLNSDNFFVSSFFVSCKKKQIKFLTDKIDNARNDSNCNEVNNVLSDLKVCFSFPWILMSGNSGSRYKIYYNYIIATLVRYFNIEDAKELYSKQNPVTLAWLIHYQIELGWLEWDHINKAENVTNLHLFRISRDMYQNNYEAKNTYNNMIKNIFWYDDTSEIVLKLLKAEKEEEIITEANRLSNYVD